MTSRATPPTLPTTDEAIIRSVEFRLRAFIEHSPMPSNLKSAIGYALFGGGKRIRPILCVRACEAVGGDLAAARDAAASLELIHCFSLVHDDLPAMDDDDLRRGRPTLHKHTNEAMAVLAGDAMTAMAFQLLSQPSGGDLELALSNVQVLTECTNGMIAGQVYDMMGGCDEIEDDFARLQWIHRHKTGMLLVAAVRMGAACGKAKRAQSESLVAYAQALGLMFQAVDDLLDVTESTEQVGKQTGKDAAAGKLTYPGLLGIEGTRAEIAKLLDQSLAALAPLGPAAEPLRAMARKLAQRTK